ncbi:VOC family protein [Prauserella cavernicola]|uniref:VOC family protein n=1 Tax=Prauserella cavernicola TaxID=2800127 RepID=A0A934QW77_9PSEU|nr:VOC family protein [Prauserella cavernicola]MBK1787548.1 VOC family protein [Prauserella cavernicola]
MTIEIPAPPDLPGAAHSDLHSEHGRRRGEHPGRSRDPIIKVRDLAWLQFEKPDLDRTEIFARDFGFVVASRTPDELRLRGTFAGTDSIVVRRGPSSRFVGPVFRAAAVEDVDRLARHTGTRARPVAPGRPGRIVEVRDPSGIPVGVVGGAEEHDDLPGQLALPLNTGLTSQRRFTRVNATQRPAREPARVQRLGHVVLETPRFQASLDWYLDTLGMIVSDFLFLPGDRDFGPTMAFIRCDRGGEPADHHTLAMHLGPASGYVHSAFQVTDLDAIAAGGEYLTERGYKRAWGIGRHIQGSQLFDYWRDPDGLMVEHFADGDVFDATVEPGWAAMSSSGLAQWGPPVTRDFLGTSPARLVEALHALRADDNDLTPARLRALMKAMNS